MTSTNSLLKTFLVYGILLLGSVYIVATLTTFISISGILGQGFDVDWFAIKGGIAFMVCLSAIGFVVRKIWITGRNHEGNRLWVYLALSFVIATSTFLFLFNILSMIVVLADDDLLTAIILSTPQF